VLEIWDSFVCPVCRWYGLCLLDVGGVGRRGCLLMLGGSFCCPICQWFGMCFLDDVVIGVGRRVGLQGLGGCVCGCILLWLCGVWVVLGGDGSSVSVLVRML